MQAQSGDALKHGPELSLMHRFLLGIHAGVSTRFLVPGRFRVSELQLQHSGVRGRIAVGVELPWGGSWSAGADLGGGVVYQSWKVTDALDDAGSGGDVRPFASVSGMLHFDPGLFRFSVAATLDAFLVRTRYVLVVGGSEQELGTASLVSPGAAIWLSYPALRRDR
jgi:hypothetical protein